VPGSGEQSGAQTTARAPRKWAKSSCVQSAERSIVSDKSDEKRPLNVPKSAPVEFERNFIGTAVCELRFPTLLELESRVPEDFQRSLRKDYPHYDTGTSLTAGLRLGTTQHHQFRSKDSHWTVTLRAFALALETERYTNFEEFLSRFERLLKFAAKLLDTDFFTRLGLRYVNHLPVKQAALEGWVNQELIQPLVAGTYGDVDRCWQEVRGRARQGAFTLRHGLGDVEGGAPDKYVIDLDFYAENGTWEDLLRTLKALHEESSALFRWAIGERAVEAMGRQTPKETRG